MKKTITLFLATLLALPLFSQPIKEQQTPAKVVASTSWTASFADLGGLDNVTSVAPASLRHPPEYEITVSDIQKIQNSAMFIYAGFERMMQTIGDSVGNVQMVQIQCDNSIATVTAMAKKIAKLAGTEKESERRVAEYVETIQEGKREVEKLGLKGAKALVNKNQIPLAKDLGLDVAATFGPGAVTSSQIADAKKNNYQLIIDNIHNPVGSPLHEVAPDATYLIWRNFPEKVEHEALEEVVEENIELLLAAFDKDQD